MGPADIRSQLGRSDTSWTLATATADYTAFKPAIAASEKDLNDYFEQAGSRYDIPPQAVVEILDFPALDSLAKVTLTDADVRAYYDATTFYVEGDGMPDPALMPTPMVGITAWQQQVPLPVSYFAGTTNPERDQGSIGFGKPNVWRLPLVPTPAASPIPISAGNFQRGAIAVAAPLGSLLASATDLRAPGFPARLE